MTVISVVGVLLIPPFFVMLFAWVFDFFAIILAKSVKDIWGNE